MRFSLIRRILALILLTLSLACFAWGAWPIPVEQRSLEFTAADLGLAPGPAWQVQLSWPSRLRVDDAAELRLAVAPQAPVPDGEVAWEAAPGGRLAARVELAGVAVTPPGEANQALGVNHITYFTWQVQAQQPGRYPVTVWLYWATQASGGRQVLSAQRLEWQAGDLFGLSGPWARALGAAGTVIGAVFGLDGVTAGLFRRFLRAAT